MDKHTVSLQLLPLLQWSCLAGVLREGINVFLIRNVVNLGSTFLMLVAVVNN